MTMLELCEPKHSLFCIHPVSVLFKIVTADPPQLQSSYEKFSKDFSNFFSRCMQKDPAQRPSCKALLDDKWIRDTVNVIVNVDEDSPTSCVVALEQLFMRYLMNDDVQALTWDADDDLTIEQEDNEPENNDKKSTSSLISPQLLALHHQVERLDSEDSGDQSSVSSKSHSKTSEDKSVSATIERLPLSQSNRQQNDKSVNVEALPDPPAAVSSSGTITIGIGPLRSLNRKVSFASDVSADEVPKEPFRHINLHAHPNSLDSTMPSMSDTPPSLRHFNSQSYIKRMIAETGQERPNSSSYRSLGSFEDTLILSSKSMATISCTSHGSMRNHDKVSLSSSNRGLSLSLSSSGSSFQSV
jgi:serine/threonine protein kinase